MTEQRSLPRATLGALGVVYGDIGTSPLYALKEARPLQAVSDSAAVLGVLSLIFWSLFIVVTLKYVVLILRADNAGEGGMLSLLALVQQKLGTCERLGDAPRRARGARHGAVLLRRADHAGDHRAERRRRPSSCSIPRLPRMVLPITLGIIVALFAMQSRGTARVGGLFGPIMVLWFGTLAVLGVREIAAAPEVLAAVSPAYALALLATHPAVALTILGAVFLVLTGAEALYADMGHFGKRPCALAWLGFVWPALLLNYFGQGALLLTSDAPIANPFFALASPGLAAGARRARDGGERHRLAGDDLRRVFRDAPGRAARSSAARESPPDLGRRARPDLRAGGQRRHVPRRRRFRARVPLLERAVGCVRRRGHRHDDHHDVARRRRRAQPLGVAAVARRRRLRFVPLVDLAFLLGNATKIASGGWVPLRSRP